MIHAALEKLHVVRVKLKAKNIGGIIGNFSANVNNSANHADTSSFAEHGRKIFAVNAANDSASAAHKLKRKTANVLEHPKFRLFVKRVVFHQRACSSSCAAADINFAAAGTMTGSVARVAFDGNQPAGI